VLAGSCIREDSEEGDSEGKYPGQFHMRWPVLRQTVHLNDTPR
jgi:hypothetical protein